MLRSSKIEAIPIADWHLLKATIFEFICYHVHVAGWLRKWPKWAVGTTSVFMPGAWHVRKSPDNVNIRWYRDLSGKKGMEFSVWKIWDWPPPGPGYTNTTCPRSNFSKFLPVRDGRTKLKVKPCSDAIWRQRSGSILAKVMACLRAPSHYLNQCWLIIS